MCLRSCGMWVRGISECLRSSYRRPSHSSVLALPCLSQIFFLEEFFETSADIIQRDVRYHHVFKEQLAGEPPKAESFDMLMEGIMMGDIPRCGALVDESQELTLAAAEGSAFHRRYTTRWTNRFSEAFVRMDAASSHGKREFELPSGEGHRVRWVQPLTVPDAAALCRLAPRMEQGLMVKSKFYIKRLSHESEEEWANRAKEVARLCGGVPRSLVTFIAAADRLENPVGRAWMAAGKRAVLTEHRQVLEKYMDTLQADRRRQLVVNLFELVSWGKRTRLYDVKDVYDGGLVLRVPDGTVVPMSPLAAEAISDGVLMEHHGSGRDDVLDMSSFPKVR